MPPVGSTGLWLVALSLLVMLHRLAADSPVLCVVVPLETPAFAAALAQPVNSRGCLSRRVTSRGQEVHAIRLLERRTGDQQTPPLVALNVRAPTDGRSYSREIVLVLDSVSAVDWSIHSPTGFSNGTTFQIIVTKRSRVVRCDLAPVTVHAQRARGREALLKFIRAKLGAVTSFSEVDAADTIELTVGIDVSAPDTCDTQAELHHHAELVPRQWKPVPLEGCYYQHLAGLGQRDVYVVEVTGGGSGNYDSRVLVRIVPDGNRKSADANLTLILKSASPVTWELAGPHFAGDLHVLAESTVRNISLGSGAALSVDREPLPGFHALVLFAAVHYSSGPPVAYLRAPALSKLDIRLGNASDGDFTEPSGDRVPLVTSAATWSSPHEWSDPSEGWEGSELERLDTADSAGSLRGSVSVTCSGGRLVVAVPAGLAGDVAVSALHLSDPDCHSRDNGTHLVMVAPLALCGTQRRSGKYGPLYFNTVHFVSSSAPLDDEDFEGSGGGFGDDSEEGDVYRSSGGSVPVSCHPPEGDPAQKVWPDIDEVGESVYGLELAIDPQFNYPIKPNLLVPLSHSIYLRSTLHMGSYLRPVVERCWLSGSHQSSAPPALLLIDSACPAQASVSWVRTDASGGDVFRLEVTPEFVRLGPYYLHCRLGVCAGPESPARQMIAQCAPNPVSRCSGGGGLGEKMASGSQVITRGPLLSSVTGGGGAAAGRRPMLQLGVSPETVAAIGVSAFLLGVALMAGVWLIHTKIGPSKRHHFQPVPQNGGMETAAPSANSTPNSQTPIILAGRSPAPAAV